MITYAYALRTVCIWVGVEVLRAVWIRRVGKKLASRPSPMAASFDAVTWASFFTERIRREQPEALSAFISASFWGLPWSSLSRADLRPFLDDMLCCQRRSQSEGEELIEHTLASLEEKLNHTFPETQSPPAPPAPFICVAKANRMPMPRLNPLPIALLRWIVRCSGDGAFRWLGFRPHRDRTSGYVFWVHTREPAAALDVSIRIKTGDSPPATPSKPHTARARPGAADEGAEEAHGLLFVHGLGLGAPPYLAFLVQLLRHPAILLKYRTILVAESPGISGHPFRRRSHGRSPYPGADETVSALARMRSKLRLGRLDAIGHSYGGLILSCVDNIEPDLFSKVIFWDSPCLLTQANLFWPDLQKRPRLRDLVSYWMNREWVKIFTWWIFNDLNHQHVVLNGSWFFDCAQPAIERAMLAPPPPRC